MEQVYPYSGPIEKDVIYPDGNTGATLLETVISVAGKNYVLPHGLGRKVCQVQVVRTNRAIGIPVWPAQDNQGNDINDEQQVGLVFNNILDEMPVTVRLRFA